MTLCSHSSPDKVSLLEMKHLCVIQLINSSARSCGRSLQVPVIFQCRKGKNQSTVSELFYHTFATDFIIQGEDIILPRSTSHQSCTMLGEFVQSWTIHHSTKHAKSIRWREANSLPYSGLSKNLPAKLQFHDQLIKTDSLNCNLSNWRGSALGSPFGRAVSRTG